ncbi:MAG: hypothetical protein Q7N95_05780 [Alphaproteobacteria bacterium]|nr:hypothetical protein [Alphaproteobacteria bacterium]
MCQHIPPLSPSRVSAPPGNPPPPAGVDRVKYATGSEALAKDGLELPVQIGQIDGIKYLSPAEQAAEYENAMSVTAHTVFRVDGRIVATIGKDGVTIIPDNKLGARLHSLFEERETLGLSPEESIAWTSRELEKRLKEMFPENLVTERLGNKLFMKTMDELYAEIEKDMKLGPQPMPILAKVDIKA